MTHPLLTSVWRKPALLIDGEHIDWNNPPPENVPS